MLAKHEQRIIDCPDCEASGTIQAGIGYSRCGLCRGELQIVITVPVDATEEDEWDATWALRQKRMPHLFGDGSEDMAERDAEIARIFNANNKERNQ
jgi:hypothetical protein